MLTFSNSSMLMSLLFSNILLMILYLIFRNTEVMIDIGYKLLVLFIAVTALRFLFPFEFVYSTNINLPSTLSRIMIGFKKPIFAIGNFPLSPWRIFLVIWIVGICIALIRCILSYRSFHKTVKTLGTDISSKEPYCSLLQEICQKYRKKNRFHIITLRGITSPMIMGIRSPYILIPEDFDVKSQDMYYILCHEASHFFHHDLLLKLFSELLCIIYWWNPFITLLKRQIATMLELRVDLQITNSQDPQDRIDYLSCLINAAKAGDSVPAPSFAISFCNTSESLLIRRFSIMIKSSQRKANRGKQLGFSVLIIGIYFFSVLFIFEPFYMPPEINEATYFPTSDNAYLIENTDGTFDFYYNDSYKATLSQMDEFLSDLPIYKKEDIK